VTGWEGLYCLAGMFGAGLFLYAGTQVGDPHLAAILIAISAGSWGFGLPPSIALAMRIIPAELMSTGIGMMNGIGNLVGALVPIFIGIIVA
jgi:hypothetical protein